MKSSCFIFSFIRARSSSWIRDVSVCIIIWYIRYMLSDICRYRQFLELSDTNSSYLFQLSKNIFFSASGLLKTSSNMFLKKRKIEKSTIFADLYGTFRRAFLNNYSLQRNLLHVLTLIFSYGGERTHSYWSKGNSWWD